MLSRHSLVRTQTPATSRGQEAQRTLVLETGEDAHHDFDFELVVPCEAVVLQDPDE